MFPYEWLRSYEILPLQGQSVTKTFAAVLNLLLQGMNMGNF